MPVDKIRQFLNRDYVEHVLYYAYCIGFELLGDLFLTQLKCICNKYQEGYTTLYQLFENLVLCLLHIMLYKNRQFILYMEKYGHAKIKKEMNKLTSSSPLKKQAADIFPENLKSFL